jgi:hypothetical protein
MTAASILAADSTNAYNLFILAMTLGPVVLLAVIIWVFFRAARRNDERERLASRERRPPTG